MSAPGSADQRNQLRVLTLNVWGLNYISKLRVERIKAIASALNAPASPTYDFVCLQEIWYESKDWRYLKSALEQRYPHAKFFLSGAFGSGLAILSRWPILETRTHPYSLNGLPIHVHHGDWFVGKACGAVTIDHPQLGLLDVWNTHFVAAGGETGPESRRSHRITQAYELATNARNSALRGRHVICAGDLNSTPPSLSIALLRDIGGLHDSFLDSHPALPAHAISLPPTRGQQGIHSHPDPQRALDELGVTCDSPLNTWSAGKRLDERARKGAGKRLDYILYRGPSDDEVRLPPNLAYHASSSGRGKLSCRESRVVFTDLVPGIEVSYSDHFGLDSTFDILPEASDLGARSSTSLTATQSRETSRKVFQTLTSALHALAGGSVRSRATQRAHFYAFAGALALAIALIISSIFQPLGGVNPVFVILAVVAGWAGTTMLYSAVVWAEWEKRKSGIPLFCTGVD